jgi:conjugative transfer signal peptidase TraF
MSAATSPLIAAGLSLGLLAAAQIDRAPRLIWNASESVPIGLYAVQPLSTPSPGDLVVVRLPDDLTSWAVERDYIGTDTLLPKRVAAVSRMTACREDFAVAIDGNVVAYAATIDRKGRPLPRWSGCVTLGADEVFLLISGVANSLDGRYFGPLSANTILGRAIPLWTYGGAEDA